MMTTAKDDWNPNNSCQKVRNSCREWMETRQGGELVCIQPLSLTALAQDIWAKHQSSASSPVAIQWDEEQWHYQPSCQLPAKVAFERLALYILAMDAINFCFWPSHRSSHKNDDTELVNFEYEHLARAMTCMAQQDEADQINNSSCLNAHYTFSPLQLVKMTVEEMTALWSSNLSKLCTNQKISDLDNMETRCRLWNEVGRVLLNQWNGNILNFLNIQFQDGTDAFTCGLTAPEMVDRIVQSFPGFRDCHAWPNTTTASTTDHNSFLYLYKRAQICVGDLDASLKLHLRDLDQLTTFADYRVPQLLRHFGVLNYEPSTLGDQIDQGNEIPSGSLEELTIRAATVMAVEEIVRELHNQQQTQSDTNDLNKQATASFTAVKVDWYLWQVGEKMNDAGTMKPHHKTRTTYY